MYTINMIIKNDINYDSVHETNEFLILLKLHIDGKVNSVSDFNENSFENFNHSLKNLQLID